MRCYVMGIVIYYWLSNRYSMRFCVAKACIFPRFSSLGFSVTIVRYTEAFCRTTPNAGSKEGFDYSFLHSLWISGDKVLNSIRHRVFKLDVSCSDNIFGNEKGGVKKLIF